MSAAKIKAVVRKTVHSPCSLVFTVRDAHRGGLGFKRLRSQKVLHHKSLSSLCPLASQVGCLASCSIAIRPTLFGLFLLDYCSVS